MAKEYVEVFGGGKSAVIKDFKEAELFSGDTKVVNKKLSAQDKGQKGMLKDWLAAMKEGQQSVPYECLIATSMATIMAVESIATGSPLRVDLSVLDKD